mgnify:CR=1 FL=1
MTRVYIALKKASYPKNVEIKTGQKVIMSGKRSINNTIIFKLIHTTIYTKDTYK